MGSFEHYKNVNGKKLRLGYTTGTCAVLAAKGAAYALLSGMVPNRIRVMTPKGIEVEVEPAECFFKGGCAVCGVKKDAGDDVDVTDGLIIYASVERIASKEILIEGGVGIGTVTKPGLDQKVGQAAINSVPRQQIKEVMLSVADEFSFQEGFKVVISAPGGEEISAKTFNPKLGITGGISIIGTGGIVEPMSLSAFSDAMRLEIRQKAAMGCKKMIFVPGNYGRDYLKREGLEKEGVPVVMISNFMGDALDEAVSCGVLHTVIAGHAGKLVKCAAGIMNTHSSMADGRAEVFVTHAALCGASLEILHSLFDSVTSDECVRILKEAGLLKETMASVMKSVYERLCARAGKDMKLGVIMFSNEYGTLGRMGEFDL